MNPEQARSDVLMSAVRFLRNVKGDPDGIDASAGYDDAVNELEKLAHEYAAAEAARHEYKPDRPVVGARCIECRKHLDDAPHYVTCNFGLRHTWKPDPGPRAGTTS